VDPADAVRARGFAPGGVPRTECPLCGETALRVILDLRGRSLLECPVCRVRCTEEHGDVSAIHAYYSTVLAHEGKADVEGRGEGVFEAIARTQADAMEALAGGRRHGRLLEIGCARGHLLAELEDRGWTVTGVDVSDASVEEARSRSGGDVLLGEPGHVGLERGSFDRICMFDVLAHLPHPRHTLQDVADLLAPGGDLVLSTVNEDWPLVPLFLRAFQRFPRRTAGIRDEMYEGQHYCYFGQENVGQLLESVGLELIEVRPLEPISVRLFLHQYGLLKRVAMIGMRKIDRVIGSSRKMLVLARKPR
jgi:SAM-dependent methyltransferase